MKKRPKHKICPINVFFCDFTRLCDRKGVFFFEKEPLIFTYMYAIIFIVMHHTPVWRNWQTQGT